VSSVEELGPATPLSRRAYLLMATARESNAQPWLVAAAVAAVETVHPDWDMEEVRTLAEWEDFHDVGDR
jgi:hypothetical protein